MNCYLCALYFTYCYNMYWNELHVYACRFSFESWGEYKIISFKHGFAKKNLEVPQARVAQEQIKNETRYTARKEIHSMPKNKEICLVLGVSSGLWFVYMLVLV